MEKEKWADVPDFPGYQVSNHGRLMRTTGGQGARAGKVLKPAANNKGYAVVTLRRDGKTVSKHVHEIVGRVWVKGYKPGLTVNHKNRNRMLNHPRNLEFMASEDNSGHGRVGRKKMRQIVSLAQRKVPPGRIARLTGLRPGVVQAVLRELS